MRDLHAQIRNAIAINDLERARDLLRQALRESPDAETYYLASQVALSDEQKRDFLGKALERDPFHKEARYALERLNLLSRSAIEPLDIFAQSSAPPYKAKPEAGSLYASFTARLIALLIDSAILFVIGTVIGFIYGALVPPPTSLPQFQQQTLIANLIGLATSTLYYIYFLTNRDGQTPGKAAMGIRIVRLDGQPLTAWDAILRNVIGYTISALILLIGYLWVLIDDKRQGWHDKLARTVVVNVR
ncbi:MAG: RDD family protein [Aggregatilineales bacterium]